MTDLEIPSLELGRYLDLVKRRRWQLVPIGLLGLLIGFIVAWSIPRYYVANTKAQLYPPLIGGEIGASNREDPFLREVNKARTTIKNYKLVKSAIEAQAWPEYFARRGQGKEEWAYVWGVAQRIEVLDLDPSENRSSAMVEISYRDQDPNRAAAFANEIRDAYLDGERESIVASARNQLNLLKDAEEKARQAYEERVAELRRFQERTGYIPGPVDPTGAGETRSRAQQYRELVQGVKSIQQEIGNLEAKIEQKKDRLSATERQVPVQNREAVPILGALADIELQIATKRAILNKWRKGTSEYERLSRQIAAAEKLKNELLEKIKKLGADQVPNPAYVELSKEIAGLGEDLAGLKRQLEIAQSDLSEFDEERAKLPTWIGEHERLVRERDNARNALDQAENRARQQQQQVVELVSHSGLIVKTIAPATPPLAPTYPNRLLLTLLGLGIGIAFALVSIIVLDVLQPTWKSLDEVARGLGGLPALGGVAHLDLPEQIEAARRKRLRWAMAGSAFVVLIGAILAIYFWEPLRLPEAVRVVLDGFLRSGG